MRTLGEAKTGFPTGIVTGWRTLNLDVEVCTDEFRALVVKELKEQVARIDAELRSLGIEPGPIPDLLERSPKS